MSGHSINGVPISKTAHNVLIGDSEFYATQCEHEDYKDVIIPLTSSSSSSVLENVLKYIEDKQFLFKRINAYRYLQTEFVFQLELIELYKMIELLELLMSKTLKTNLIRVLGDIVACHPFILEPIQNDLLFFEKEYLLRGTRHRGMIIKKDGLNPCKYRFNDDLWIEMKVGIFNLTILRSVGCSYVQVGSMTTLFRLPPQTELEIKVQKLKSLDIDRIEYDYHSFRGKQINMRDCQVYYTNGSMYHGSLRFDAVLGFQRHGLGKFFSTFPLDSLDKSGFYLYDAFIYITINAGVRSFCNCLNYGIAFEGLDEDDHDEDEIDEYRCFFNSLKTNCLEELSETKFGHFDATLTMCEDCKVVVLEHLKNLYVARINVWSLLCDFPLPDMYERESGLHDVLMQMTTGLDYFWEDRYLKDVKTYEDYIHYVLPNSSRAAQSDTAFRETVRELQQIMKKQNVKSS
jgi:hypothetical protein